MAVTRELNNKKAHYKLWRIKRARNDFRIFRHANANRNAIWSLRNRRFLCKRWNNFCKDQSDNVKMNNASQRTGNHLKIGNDMSIFYKERKFSNFCHGFLNSMNFVLTWKYAGKQDVLDLSAHCNHTIFTSKYPV